MFIGLMHGQSPPDFDDLSGAGSWPTLVRMDRSNRQSTLEVDPALLVGLEALRQRASPDRVPTLIVAGCQGSGKTTLCQAAARAWRGVQISIDDVYLTRAEREAMAVEVHPLFRTRGPPGTHDLAMLRRLIDQLRQAGPQDVTLLPDFDKRGDDRRSREQWHRFAGRPSVILIDAWCLGAEPEDPEALADPINRLERDQDADGTWRRHVNAQLTGDYARFVQEADGLLFLKAPGFEVVQDWRCQQEAALLGLAPGDLPQAEKARLAGFVQYFERLTRRMLSGAVRADTVVSLDNQRRILGIEPAS